MRASVCVWCRNGVPTTTKNVSFLFPLAAPPAALSATVPPIPVYTLYFGDSERGAPGPGHSGAAS